MHDAAGVSSACLQTGAPMEDDHYIFAQVARLILLAFAQAFAGGHHEHNGDDAPGDPEHGEEGAKLMRPESSQHVKNEIT